MFHQYSIIYIRIYIIHEYEIFMIYFVLITTLFPRYWDVIFVSVTRGIRIREEYLPKVIYYNSYVTSVSTWESKMMFVDLRAHMSVFELELFNRGE